MPNWAAQIPLVNAQFRKNRSRTKRDRTGRKMAEPRLFATSRCRSGREGRRFKSCRSEAETAGGEHTERSVIRSETPPVTPQLRARFWSYVAKAGPDECWPWTGARSSAGYGSFKLPSRVNITASRYAYLLSAGQWPGRYLVCHSCDNPPCCNPAHLWLGLTADNSADMVAKGRQRSPDQRGSKNGRAKLTEADIPKIRDLIAAGLTNVAIGELFGVSHGTISLIRLGKFWTHVEAA